MKEEVVRTLIIARSLLESANPLCLSENTSTASAGLIILQDAVELIFLACLRELEVDNERDIDNLGIKKMLQVFHEKGFTVIKQDKIKALDKQRVIVKHFGQQADIGTVKEYHAAALEAVDDLLVKILGQPLDEIMLHQLVLSEPTRNVVQEAIAALDRGDWVDALAATRKALFIEIENEYNIYNYKDTDETAGILGFLFKGGHKAPWHTRKREWIQQNVATPFDYIQLDHERLKIDLMEWGIPTQDYWNVWRLTPAVFRAGNDAPWIKEGEIVKHLAATEENARYCLDRVLSIILKKQAHQNSARWIRDITRFVTVQMQTAHNVYKTASLNSEIIGQTVPGTLYHADLITPSLDLDTTDKFFKIRNIAENQQELRDWWTGYVLDSDDVVIVEDQEEEVVEQPPLEEPDQA